uniref:Uncharacterized protein n=1 Tax=Anguilla anguilla TaxID=7936 RepID=A0A0E9WAR1_ANGAN
MTTGRQDACVVVTSRDPEQQKKINHYVNLSRISVLGIIFFISFPCALYNCCTKKPNNNNTTRTENEIEMDRM